MPPNRPMSIIAKPAKPTTSATTVTARLRGFESWSSDSRSAAIGVTRVALRAGTSAATSVTTTPTISETITVRSVTTVPVFGRSIPTALKSSLIPNAKPTPPASPSAAPSRPSTSASKPTVASSCGREAPSVRSMPNSRVRWATVIENVLKIWNAPTNSDTPANTSSAIRRNFRLSAMSSVWR